MNCKSKWTLISMFLGLFVPAIASAGEADMWCYSKMGDGFPATGWATESMTNLVGGIVPHVDTTAVGSGTETTTRGFTFPDGDDTEINCMVMLPSDYDFEGTTPYVKLAGWAEDNACFSGTRKVRLLVSSRRYYDDIVANVSWNATDLEDISYPCVGSVRAPYVVKMRNIDAAPDASYWTAGDLVFIRIQRDGDVGDSLPVGWHLAGWKLIYPN